MTAAAASSSRVDATWRTSSASQVRPNRASPLSANAISNHSAACIAGVYGGPTTPSHSTSSTTISAPNSTHDAGADTVSSTNPASSPDIPPTQPLPNTANGT